METYCAHKGCGLLLGNRNRSGFCGDHTPAGFYARPKIKPSDDTRQAEVVTAGVGMQHQHIAIVSLPKEPWL
ncbi:MAG: hypothetical protein AAFQ58_19135 [Pseudomonadota bacterium]